MSSRPAAVAEEDEMGLCSVVRDFDNNKTVSNEEKNECCYSDNRSKPILTLIARDIFPPSPSSSSSSSTQQVHVSQGYDDAAQILRYSKFSSIELISDSHESIWTATVEGIAPLFSVDVNSLFALTCVTTESLVPVRSV
jgi:hypothetical protein